MSYLLALHPVGDVLLDKLYVLGAQLVNVIVLLFYLGGHRYFGEK